MSDECSKMSPPGSPEGYQIVAGGRSEAQTTGLAGRNDRTPTGCQMKVC